MIPDDCAAEKRDAIKACPGVDVHVVQSAAISFPAHYVNVARKLAKELNEQGKTAIFADQFDNLCNWRTHLNTAHEIRNEIGGVDRSSWGAARAARSRAARRSSTKLVYFSRTRRVRRYTQK